MLLNNIFFHVPELYITICLERQQKSLTKIDFDLIAFSKCFEIRNFYWIIVFLWKYCMKDKKTLQFMFPTYKYVKWHDCNTVPILPCFLKQEGKCMGFGYRNFYNHFFTQIWIDKDKSRLNLSSLHASFHDEALVWILLNIFKL